MNSELNLYSSKIILKIVGFFKGKILNEDVRLVYILRALRKTKHFREMGCMRFHFTLYRWSEIHREI